VVARSGAIDPALTDTKPRVPICGSGKGTAHASITCHLAFTILLLASASNTATAARVCIAAYFHYGGSGLHRDRVHAQASAVRAWRAIQAESHGARAATNMYPDNQQPLHLHLDKSFEGDVNVLRLARLQYVNFPAERASRLFDIL
jgi:hypothetical protein